MVVALWHADVLAQQDELPADLSGEAQQNALDELSRDVEALSLAAEKHLGTATQRSEALGQLAKGVERMMTLLDEARAANEKLRARIAVLTDELERARAENALLDIDADEIKTERDRLAQDLKTMRTRASAEEDEVITLKSERDALASRNVALADELAALRAQLGESESTVAQRDTLIEQLSAAADAEKDRIASEQQSAEQARADLTALQQQLGALRLRLTDANVALAQAAGQLDDRQTRIDDLEARLKAQLSTEQEGSQQVAQLNQRISELENDLEALGVALNGAEAKLDHKERELAERDKQLEAATGAGQVRIERLNQQIDELRDRLSQLTEALSASDALIAEQEVQITDLDRQLTEAMAARIERLERYRSDFFGRLRDVLGDKYAISIVGDRFVLQSDVLFDSGSAELSYDASEKLDKLAQTLRELAVEIPPDVDWILRVDGHTDRVPIHTDDYDSNWDLSTARAISVVNFLIRKGVPPPRLAATGFGEFQPIDPRDDEIAFRRNRRIEFRLTSP